MFGAGVAVLVRRCNGVFGTYRQLPWTAFASLCPLHHTQPPSILPRKHATTRYLFIEDPLTMDRVPTAVSHSSSTAADIFASCSVDVCCGFDLSLSPMLSSPVARRIPLKQIDARRKEACANPGGSANLALRKYATLANVPLSYARDHSCVLMRWTQKEGNGVTSMVLFLSILGVNARMEHIPVAPVV